MAPTHELTPPSLEAIQRAKTNIADKAIRTPLLRFACSTTPPDTEIYLKCENLQPIGSFKCRPAANAIAEADRDRVAASGVCTASAGNFGQGLAWCCSELGIVCTVVAPTQTPQTKLAAMKRLDANIIKVPYEEWWQCLETRQCPQAPEGAVFIHPGAESSVLAGNATVAAEILEELPDVDMIVAPWGSGALATGISFGIQAIQGDNPTCRVLSVEPETAAPFYHSLKRGRPCELGDSWQASFVDGAGGKAVLEPIWTVGQKYLQKGLLDAAAVPLEAIADAIRVLATQNGLIVEGAGGAPVAAALSGSCGPHAKKIVCVVSGRGIDPAILCAILEGKTAARDLVSVNKNTPNYDARLVELKFELPTPPEPKGLYTPAVISGNHVYVSGHGPASMDGKSYMQGVIGQDLTVEEGRLAGRATGLAALSSLRAVLGGSLNRVKRIVKVLGMVNGVPELQQLECVAVVNGFSEIMVQVFGDAHGVGARSAVMVKGLPMNIPMEVEMIVELVE